MEHAVGSYGLWSLVILNSLIFIIFAFSFAMPQTKTDWRSFGAFSAFLLALFTEMYGFPLTIYLFSGWLQTSYPDINWFAHDSGHLLEMMFGWEGNPHFGPFHILSFVFIGGGFWVLSAAWKVLYKAQREGKMAVTGLYKKIRHPQYIGFIAIMFGFLLQWPTILTLVLFPILTYMYIRLAKKEERDSQQRFGKAHVPGFIPKWSTLFNN